jgi:Fe2+ transport system protein FeoA
MELPSLRTGQAGIIASVNASCICAKRLADLGFVRGARLEVVRSGNPCIVFVNGTKVALGVGAQRGIDLSRE